MGATGPQRLDPEKVQALWKTKRGEEAGRDTTAKIDTIWKNNDKNSDGKIDRDEANKLCKAFLLKSDNSLDQSQLDTDKIDAVFIALDTDGDGALNRDELGTAM